MKMFQDTPSDAIHARSSRVDFLHSNSDSETKRSRAFRAPRPVWSNMLPNYTARVTVTLEDADQLDRGPRSKRPNQDSPLSDTSELTGATSLENLLGEPRQFAAADNVMLGSRPNKMQSISSVKRSETFWHLDGNVILQFGNVTFRLHQSMLERKSPYFRKFFQSTTHVQSMDYKPLYELEGDADDFAKLLEFLDEPPIVSQPLFQQIAPVLRAAKRFEFEHALAWGLGHLLNIFLDNGFPIKPRPYAAQAVRFGEECGDKEILKPALYDLLRQQDFGAAQSKQLTAGSRRLKSASSSSFTGLTAQCNLQLVQARETMQTAWMYITNPLNSLDNAGTKRIDGCSCDRLLSSDGIGGDVDQRTALSNNMDKEKENRGRDQLQIWVKTIWGDLYDDDPSIFSVGSLDVMEGLKRLVYEPWTDFECSNCLEARKRDWKDKRQALWEQLDTSFDLATIVNVSDALITSFLEI